VINVESLEQIGAPRGYWRVGPSPYGPKEHHHKPQSNGTKERHISAPGRENTQSIKPLAFVPVSPN
jgi:hypothetical protein